MNVLIFCASVSLIIKRIKFCVVPHSYIEAVGISKEGIGMPFKYSTYQVATLNNMKIIVYDYWEKAFLHLSGTVCVI